MNQLFNKIARESVVEKASGFREFDANVFAERIVKECAGLFDHNDMYTMIPEGQVFDIIISHFKIKS